MKRVLWGEFTDDSGKRQEVQPDEIILTSQKAEKLKALKKASKDIEQRVVKLKLKNPLVTQTIEVMNQTEMVRGLIDTYANKSGYNNYLLNPCQMIPQIDFPQENAADLVSEEKLCKPFWFMPPIETDFSRGAPQIHPRISRNMCRAAIRKSTCGLLRVAGFTDAAHSALVMLTDAVDEFIKTLLVHVNDVQKNEDNEAEVHIDILTLEKAYYALTHSSLTSIHNYFKNDIIGRNRSELSEFKSVYQEYDKMIKESQSMQKVAFKDDDFLNFLDFSGGVATTVSGPTQPQTEITNVGIMSFLDNTSEGNNPSGSTGYKDIFQGEIVEADSTQEEQIQYAVGPPSME